MGVKKNWALLALLALAIIMVPVSSFLSIASGHRMAAFRSYTELNEFIAAHSLRPPPVDCGSTDLLFSPRPSSWSLTASSARSSTEYSTTNVQVGGVDELDKVKTDGEYLYTITGSSLFILKAYPAAEARILSRIVGQGSILGVFVKGERLALLTSPQSYYPNDETTVWVYDLSDRASPMFMWSVSMNGTYVGSRMIDDRVYIVGRETVQKYGNGTVTLPEIFVDGTPRTIQPWEIYHSDLPDYVFAFAHVMGVSLRDNRAEPVVTTFLMGASGTIYVSLGNLYITSPVYTGEGSTVIHRVNISEGQIVYEATGEVPGNILNQFSMDEFAGYFRVATNLSPIFAFAPAVLRPAPVGPTSCDMNAEVSHYGTNVYTLDMDLRIVGRLEGLAPDEFFHSARFIGERAYLVTFKKVDPLFVIDLQDPSRPTVLGELKVTGYSDYLHPYDENHLIGIGKETVDAGSFAWYQGVKISLFDVTNPERPWEISKVEIGERGTDSEVLRDHHAFLFDREKNLLVLPINLYENSQAVSGWGSFVWQGAYVFSIGLEKGLVSRGRISHFGNGETPQWNSERFVTRSLHIGEVLYTVSEEMVKMNSLADLHEINFVSLF